ncbi:MAG: pilus assembly protein PilM [bacterium]|nr:pilus assembly protein PilM [bacterium]
MQIKSLTGLTKKYSVGIDISDTGVKMIALARQGKQYTVVGFAEGTFGAEAHCDGKMVDSSACGNAIVTVWKKIKQTIPKTLVIATASLSDVHTQMALIQIPASLITEERIREEAGKHIPMHPDTTITSWQIIDTHEEMATVFVITVARDTSDALASALEKAECFPSSIESEAIALARLFGGSEPRVIIDLGATRTLFLLAHHDVPLFTISLPLTGHMLTEAIAKTLRLPLAEAEATKIRCGFDDTACQGALREIIETHLHETVQRIGIGLDEITAKEKPLPKDIVLVGGGAHLKKIDSILAKELGIPVTQGNMWSIVQEPSNFPEHPLAWAVALGLALRDLS